MNRRFTVVRDDPQKCWRIFDTASNKFTPYKHERQVYADAEAAELNEMDANGGITLTENEEESPVGRPQIVLNALAGKVKCSRCDCAYLGEDPDGCGYRWDEKFGNHSIRITRFLGAGDPKSQLIVDLTCNVCEHSGMYRFENNPIFLDIQF